jgi:hypothetical protein
VTLTFETGLGQDKNSCTNGGGGSGGLGGISQGMTAATGPTGQSAAKITF